MLFGSESFLVFSGRSPMITVLVEGVNVLGFGPTQKGRIAEANSIESPRSAIQYLGSVKHGQISIPKHSAEDTIGIYISVIE
jgi:hypothetical protein